MRFVAAVALLAGSVPAYAWGPEGHSLVARIAWAQLRPAARARVAAILAPDQTMVSIASWADEVRRSRPESAPWHFVDIPIGKPHFDMARDCPKDACVIAKIADLRKTLNDPATGADQRREALMFLVHFVGDMHQPLHCSDHEDRGGNSVRVQFFDRQSNLHSVWDSGLLNRFDQKGDALFDELSRESAKHAREWSKGTVIEWAEQSHRAAQTMVYGRLPRVPDGALVPLSAKYQRRAEPLIRIQIEKAGARLASILNADLR